MVNLNGLNKMATLPEGFTLDTPDSPPQSSGNLPPGFVLDSAPEPQQQAQPTGSQQQAQPIGSQQQITPRKRDLATELQNR